MHLGNSQEAGVAERGCARKHRGHVSGWVAATSPGQLLPETPHFATTVSGLVVISTNPRPWAGERDQMHGSKACKRETELQGTEGRI